jgi:RNA polymerase sigma-70 factor, ECF subfamily
LIGVGRGRLRGGPQRLENDTLRAPLAARLGRAAGAVPESASMTAHIDLAGVPVPALRDEEPGGAEQLISTYGDRVYRLAIRITGLTADAEQVAQDALWTAARGAHVFRGQGDAAFGSWLGRVTARAAYEKLRARKGPQAEILWEQIRPDLEPLDDWSSQLDEYLPRGELGRELMNALEGLPPDHRTALVMHDIEGMSNPEIAETLGISLPAAKVLVHRSRLIVRQWLDDRVSEQAVPLSLFCTADDDLAGAPSPMANILGILRHRVRRIAAAVLRSFAIKNPERP